MFLTDSITKTRDISSSLVYNHSAAMQHPEGSANTHCLARETQQAVTDRENDFKRKVKAKRAQVKYTGDEKGCQIYFRCEWDTA